MHLAFRPAKDTKWILVTFLMFGLPTWPYKSTAFGEELAPDALPEGRESIADIMDASGTDKLTRHAYERYYERIFAEFRDMADLRILEIGADSGISLKVRNPVSRLAPLPVCPPPRDITASRFEVSADLSRKEECRGRKRGTFLICNGSNGRQYAEGRTAGLESRREKHPAHATRKRGAGQGRHGTRVPPIARRQG